MSKKFIQEVTDGLLAPPNYFFKDVMMNKNDFKSTDVVLETNHKALVQELKKEIDAGAFILDTRKPEDFAVKHMKSAVNIELNGQYAPWVRQLFQQMQRLCWF